MTAESIVPETLERLAASFGDGEEGWAFVRELIDAFLEDAPVQLAAVRSAVEQGEAAEARRAAHTLKSNAATFGATSLTDVSRELEAAAARGELDGAAGLLEQAELEWERAGAALERVGAGGPG
jgi:HPt (histidine-containing phosphotransfer) domain-containing protein